MATRDSQTYGLARYIFLVSGRGRVVFWHTIEARHATHAIAAVNALFGDRQVVLQVVERID